MKPREPRHKILVRARMKAGAGWHDTCILNVSSRGMLMQAGIPPVTGSYLEIHRGALVIVARVVWTRSHRFGVRSQDPLSLEAIIGATPVSPENCAATVDRRRVERPRLPVDERSRSQGRLIEYGFAAALAIAAAVFAAGQVYSLLARPIDALDLALSVD